MKEISPFNEEEISFLVAFNAFRTSPFIAAIKEFKETLNDKGAPIDWRSTHKGKVIQLLTGQPRNRIATVLFLRCYRPFSIPLWIARVFDDRETFGCGYRFLKRNEREIAKTYGRY